MDTKKPDQPDDKAEGAKQRTRRIAFISAASKGEKAVAGDTIIVCRQPGLRRGGLVHPAVAVYPDGHFTSDQIKSLTAEPLLEVLGVL
ncbi:hypothetical protein AD929_11630 [Gluconobacter potus]|uniref:Uncharacterized protein n=1 Tax=Gluconobacter potus TaxID=2724927 RepID=A0A149QSI5_9PROT|nr:hypothetical protein [Gluconobacter potus]KXV00278.1 hypothetical protein AD929_11630 [Gluconobacter potus]